MARTKSSACATRSASQSCVLGRVGRADAEVRGDGPAEQERLLRDEADRLPEVRPLEVADVDAVDPDRARGRVGEAGDERDQRGLATPRAPDDGRRLAGSRRERDVADDRVLGTGVRVGRALELERPAGAGTGDRDRGGGIGDGGDGREDLVDALGRHGGPRHQDEHDHGHHHGHQDLGDVLEERDEVADRHLAAVDAQAPEPQDRDRRQVEDEHQDRDQQGEQPVHPDGRRRQFEVGDVEAGLLVLRANERPDDADARERLPRDLVDAVDADLEGAEERDRAREHHPDDQRHDRQDHDEDAGERDVLAEGHDHPADGHDRRQDHHVEAHQDDDLDLLDIVRVPGDERWRAEPVELGLGERLDRAEDAAAHVPAEGHADPGAEVDGDDRRDPEDGAHQEHHAAHLQDVVGVALGDAVVDDVGVELGQIEVRDRLDEQQEQDQRDRPRVRAQVATEQSDEGHPRACRSVIVSTSPWKAASSVGSRTDNSPLHLGQPQAGELQDDASPLGGQVALDDAPVVGAMAPLDEAVALDPLDEAGGPGRCQVEQLGDPPHRLRALAMEQDQEAQLAERQVTRRQRRSRRGRREHAHDISRDDLEVGGCGPGRSIAG